ncbi:MAG: phosphatase PAP2 family protein [Chthoniobacterales bacterium]
MPLSLDHQLFLSINADHGLPWLDLFMAIFSSFDFWLPFFIAAGLLLAWRGGFRARAMLVCLLLTVALMEGALVNPLKDAIGRVRPIDALPEARSVSLAKVSPRLLAVAQPVRVKPAKIDQPPKPGKSLPSGHTANMFCFATVLAAFYGWRGALFFLPAGLVGFSRIATGSHWPSDVLLSAVFSIAVTAGLLAVYCWLWRRLAPRYFPALATAHPGLLGRA